jgi:hypothetical protein
MTVHNVKFLKTGAEAKALVEKEQHKTTGKPPKGQVDDVETLAKLPVWQRTSTTLAAKYVYRTGAAIMANSTVPGKALPYLKDTKKILKEIDWHKHGFVTALLRDVLFWHHQSTYGRFNDQLGRFERWGVKSVLQWYNHQYDAPNPDYKSKGAAYEKKPWSKTIDKWMLSRASFFRIKDRLLGMGLIEAESHLRRDLDQMIKAKIKGKSAVELEVTALWIKPTEELCRIVFEPGYWETVRSKYANVPTKKKPRGVHAKAKNGTSNAAFLAPPIPKNETSPLPTLSI